MKSLLSYCLLSFILFSFFACTKEVSHENGSQPTSAGNGNFYSTIDGKAWNADSLQIALVNNGMVRISGLSKTGEQFTMILPAFKVGTYTLSATSSGYILYVSLISNPQNAWLSNIGSASGKVTISGIDSVNKTVSGTFQVNLVNPFDNSVKSVTKGVFNNVPYISGNVVPPPGGVTDTLLATIDGSKFDAIQILPNVNAGALVIAGIAADGRNLDLVMPATVSPGSYSFDIATGTYIGAYFPSSTAAPLVSINNGSLTILMNDTVARRIKGTFSFIASTTTNATTANITKGYFSMNY